jgi:Ca2+/Na+ antiporter
VTAVALTVYSGDNDPSSRVRSLLGLEPSTASRQGRALLSAGGSCGETPGWEKNGGIVAYIVGVFFMFLGIAIVCDDFFVASLEKICEVLRLSDDVAGATFMAAGSSAPELASSAMSLINPNAGSEIGVGTIVGSAIFNILIIIGATVIATGNTLQLDWKPVTRDCFFYAAAIGGIVGTFAGGRVDWWEGGIYVAFYASYIITMMYNVRLMRWLDSFEASATVKSFKARLSFRSARAEALSEQRSEREAKYRAEGEDIRAGDARTDETAAETARRVAAASKSPSDQPSVREGALGQDPRRYRGEGPEAQFRERRVGDREGVEGEAGGDRARRRRARRLGRKRRRRARAHSDDDPRAHPRVPFGGCEGGEAPRRAGQSDARARRGDRARHRGGLHRGRERSRLIGVPGAPRGGG